MTESIVEEESSTRLPKLLEKKLDKMAYTPEFLTLIHKAGDPVTLLVSYPDGSVRDEGTIGGYNREDGRWLVVRRRSDVCAPSASSEPDGTGKGRRSRTTRKTKRSNAIPPGEDFEICLDSSASSCLPVRMKNGVDNGGNATLITPSVFCGVLDGAWEENRLALSVVKTELMISAIKIRYTPKFTDSSSNLPLEGGGKFLVGLLKSMPGI